MKKYLKIRLLERREEDTWFDLGKRELRSGEVCFYKINDVLTGEWLIKTCLDDTKIILKANKCPSGHLISQLENQSMIFQKSLVSNMYYGVISTTYVDEKQRVKRKSISSLDDVPPSIRNFYDIKSGMVNGVLYPALDPSIFEVKYPNSDIQGKVLGDNLGTQG